MRVLLGSLVVLAEPLAFGGRQPNAREAADANDVRLVCTDGSGWFLVSDVLGLEPAVR